MQRSGNAGPAVNSRPVTVNDRWCKGCDICVVFCPKKVLERPEGGKAQVVRGEDCTRCGICEMMCPDFAITLAPAGDKKESGSGSLGGNTDA